MSLSFRVATLEDVPAIHTLVERAYRGPEAMKGWTTEAVFLVDPRTSVEELSTLAERDDARFVLAIDGGSLVGSALIEQRGTEGYFGMLAVEPSQQAGGVGKALLAELERQVQELWGCTAMTLWVIGIRDELIAWYGRRGYQLTGRREPFPPEYLGNAKRRDLEFLEMRKLFSPQS